MLAETVRVAGRRFNGLPGNPAPRWRGLRRLYSLPSQPFSAPPRIYQLTGPRRAGLHPDRQATHRPHKRRALRASSLQPEPRWPPPSTRDTVDPTDPRHLTAEQRLDELSALLATGVRRLLALRLARQLASLHPHTSPTIPPPQIPLESAADST